MVHRRKGGGTAPCDDVGAGPGRRVVIRGHGDDALPHAVANLTMVDRAGLAVAARDITRVEQAHQRLTGRSALRERQQGAVQPAPSSSCRRGRGRRGRGRRGRGRGGRGHDLARSQARRQQRAADVGAGPGRRVVIRGHGDDALLHAVAESNKLTATDWEVCLLRDNRTALPLRLENQVLRARRRRARGARLAGAAGGDRCAVEALRSLQESAVAAES
jgi:hypothetical protein